MLLRRSAVHDLFLGARPAFLEVFCGCMQLTLGVRAHGLCAPDGVDQTFPVGDQPWDLSLPEDQGRCRDLEDRLDPIVIHYAPPCTQFCSTGPHHPPEHPDYRIAVGLVNFSIEGIARRVEKGAEASVESPYAARMWQLDPVINFFG